MAPRGKTVKDAVKHGFVSKIAGGCSSYDIIAPWPDLVNLFYQKLRKVYPIRYTKTRPFFRYLRKTSGAPTPCLGKGYLAE